MSHERKHAPRRPPVHWSARQPGFHRPRMQMIGRLTAAEFDILEMVKILGGSTDTDQFAARLGIGQDAALKRLQRVAYAGLFDVEKVPVDHATRSNAKRCIYTFNDPARLLFGEALEAMDAALSQMELAA